MHKNARLTPLGRARIVHLAGKRLAASVPYGHWMTMTFIAALTL